MGASFSARFLELYSGTFRLFRNPTAHGLVGYSPAEGKAIIGFVNLLLKILKRAEELPPPDMFPENVEKALRKTEEVIGPGAASRLRVFLGKCVRELSITPTNAKEWIPFRGYCLYHPDHWEQPKPHRVGLFYLVVSGARYDLSFPTTQYYANVVGFDVDQLVEELTDLAFRPSGKSQHPAISLKVHNDQAFFDALFDVVARTVGELEETLRQG